VLFSYVTLTFIYFLSLHASKNALHLELFYNFKSRRR